MIDKLRNKPWIIQKYGGTSIGKLLDTITGSIIPGYLPTCNVAIVCSARSGSSKSKGTTSLLLEAIHCATSSETSTKDLDRVIDTIKEEHLEAAHSAVPARSEHIYSRNILKELESDIEKDCETLRSFLKATWTVGEISERTQDRVLAVGEKLSCRMMVASLKNKGVDAEIVLLDDIVQEAYSKNVRDQRALYERHPSTFLQGLSKTIENRILNCDHRVPVITGFFGAMPDSLIHTVGRGYSDLCAALCAVSVSAQELQVWKEVDGIFTADPSKIESARLLATVTSEEAAELTYYGSEVIHPLTIEQIGYANIPLRLKNVKNPSGSGTIIFPSRSLPRSPGSQSPGSQSPGSISPSQGSTTPENSSISPTPLQNEVAMPRAVFMASHGYHGEDQQRRTPTAVTTKDAITVLNIHSNGRTKPQAFLGQIAERIGRHEVTIHIISSSKQSISLAVSPDGSDVDRDSIGRAVADLKEIGDVTVMKHMSIVSVVGHKLRNVVGVDGEIFSALASARVNINLISQGASEISICFVVRAQDALLAMDVVHTKVMRIPAHHEQEMNFIKGPWLY